MSKSSAMTRIQLLILIGLSIVIIALSLPPWWEYYRLASQADTDINMIAAAIKKYHRHTGEYPAKLENLVINPGLAGWRGNYLESIPKTPWGGNYQLLHNIYKVCIPHDHPRVPEKYRLGGIAEISNVYFEGEDAAKYWWSQKR